MFSRYTVKLSSKEFEPVSELCGIRISSLPHCLPRTELVEDPASPKFWFGTRELQFNRYFRSPWNQQLIARWFFQYPDDPPSLVAQLPVTISNFSLLPGTDLCHRHSSEAGPLSRWSRVISFLLDTAEDGLVRIALFTRWQCRRQIW